MGGLPPKSPIVGSPLPATVPGEGSRVPPRLLRPSPSLLAVLSPGNVPKPEGTGVSAPRAPFLPSTSAKPSKGPSLGPRTGHPQKGHRLWGGVGRGGQGSCHHICNCVERPHEDPGPEDPWTQGPTCSRDPVTPLSQSCLALARPHLSWPLEYQKEKGPVSPLTGQGFGGQ